MRNEVRPASSCIANIVLPWSHLTINDSNFNASNGFPPRQVYVEAVDFLPGLAGESRDFDANGPYIRVLGNGGTFTYSLQPGLFGQSLAPISSVEPEPPPGELAAAVRTERPVRDAGADHVARHDRRRPDRSAEDEPRRPRRRASRADGARRARRSGPPDRLAAGAEGDGLQAAAIAVAR